MNRLVLPGIRLLLSAAAIGAVYYVRQLAAPVALPEMSPAHRMRSQCPATGGDDFYFAAGTFLWFDRFARPRASAHLEAAREASLSCGPSLSVATLRLTWLRSAHNPIVVRVDRRHDGAHATAIALRPTADPRAPIPVTFAWRLDQQLSAEEFVELETALDRAAVWTTLDKGSDGSDQSEWIVERRRGDTYKAAHRFAPGPGPFRDACLLLLKAADVTVPADEIY